jgi:hypothetical protein
MTSTTDIKYDFTPANPDPGDDYDKWRQRALNAMANGDERGWSLADHVLGIDEGGPGGPAMRSRPPLWQCRVATHVDDVPGVATSALMIEYILNAIRVVYACEMVPWKKVLGFKVTVDDKLDWLLSVESPKPNQCLLIPWSASTATIGAVTSPEAPMTRGDS